MLIFSIISEHKHKLLSKSIFSAYGVLHIVCINFYFAEKDIAHFEKVVQKGVLYNFPFEIVVSFNIIDDSVDTLFDGNCLLFR